MREFIKNLKEKLFGSGPQKEQAKGSPTTVESKLPSLSIPSSGPPVFTRKAPYFIQVGFDFGTIYSKCVCRDLIVNKAWVHIPTKSYGQALPFLIPSALKIKDGIISHVDDPSIHYPENGIYHLKNALVKAALGQFNDQVLNPYRSVFTATSTDHLCRFVESCAVYFLAGALGDVRVKLRQRFPNFGQVYEDYMAVNLAVPVGNAERPEVNRLYQKIICEAWCLADRLHGHPPIKLTELESLRKELKPELDQSVSEACFIYPEVSANVQGFVRSRVSSQGIYLFSDTGGGTVDQSVFIFFTKEDGIEHLTYLHGSVIPLGSSLIEQTAASFTGCSDCRTLEMLRKKKEEGKNDPKLKEARDKINKDLSLKTRSTLAYAKRKLFRREQLHDIRIIFGGGGHCHHPYETSVVQTFKGDLFPIGGISPSILGLPKPRDLELENQTQHWMDRLYVAYGLSFVKTDLINFTYPRDVTDPESDEIWTRSKIIPEAPTKDVC